MGRGAQVKGRGTGDPVLPNDLERPVHRLGSSCSSGAKNTHNKTLRQGPRVEWISALESETERQVLSAASGIAIHKGSKADLVGNSEARQSLDDDADHDAEHGSAAIKELNALELIHVDLPLGGFLKTVLAGWGVGHGLAEVNGESLELQSEKLGRSSERATQPPKMAMMKKGKIRPLAPNRWGG